MKRAQNNKMKSIIIFVTISLIISCSEKSRNDLSINKDKQKVSTSYKIILKTYNTEPMGKNDSIEVPGEVDSIVVSKLNERFKALEALYS